MKKHLRSLLSCVMAGFFAVTLASAVAAQRGGCDYLLGGIDSGVSCYYKSHDAEYCYYDCYCTGSSAQCNQFYAANGLEVV